MRGLLALSNLFSKMSSLPEDQSDAHQIILETVAATIGQASTGFVAINEGEGWTPTATKGVRQAALDPAAGIGLFLKEASFRATDRTLCGSFRTDGGTVIALRLDAGSGAGATYDADDKVVFKVALDLTCAYETFQASRQEIKNVRETVKQILDLVSGLREADRDSDSFFAELLRSALSVVDEADYGSVALLDRGHWHFVAAVGHDLEGLQRLTIPAEAFGSFSEVAVFDDVLSRDDILSPQVMAAIQSHSLPISRSMIVGMDVGPDYRVNLSLDIRQGSGKRFLQGSQLAMDRFVRLASSFLRLRHQGEFVERSYRNFTDKLAILAEAHDRNTSAHNARVSMLSGFLAEKMGLASSAVQGIRKGAMVHDIGKLFLSPELLNKKGKLTEEERDELKAHTLLAEKLLDDPYFELDQKIAVYHHERFDGLGYPRGLRGDQIPIEAQIVSVADVYDALRDTRSYKVAYPPLEALSRMRYGDGRLAAGGFNPEILKVLEDNWEVVERMWEREAPAQEPPEDQATFVFDDVSGVGETA